MSPPQRLRTYKKISFILVALAVLASCAEGAAPPSDAGLLTRIKNLERQVEDLESRRQIHDVYLRYVRGFDRSDINLMRSAFWPDVQINYGAQSNTFDEFVVRHLEKHKKHLENWGHLITNESMEINGDVAHVEAYVTAFFTPKEKSSPWSNATIWGARYIDRLDRRSGEWRISVRETIGYFSSNAEPAHDLSHGSLQRSKCPNGTWDEHDPSYVRPLKARTDRTVGPPCAE